MLNRECFIVRDHDSHALACVYFEDVVDRHAAIPEVSIWTAAENLPVKAKAGVASAPDSDREINP